MYRLLYKLCILLLLLESGFQYNFFSYFRTVQFDLIHVNNTAKTIFSPLFFLLGNVIKFVFIFYICEHI